MTIEERRAELVAFVENEYGGQEVLKLADAYALAVLKEAFAVHYPHQGYALLLRRIEALR